MKIEAGCRELAKALAPVKGVALRDGVSPYAMVRLDATGPGLSLTGSNGDVQVETRLEAKVDGSGFSRLVPCGLFARCVEVMGGAAMEMSERQSRLTMSSGRTLFRLPLQPGEGFPVMAPPGTRPGADGTLAKPGALFVAQQVLREMLRKTRFAACTAADRAILCGVYVAWDPGKRRISMAATDGNRLAEVTHDLPPEEDQPPLPDTAPEGSRERVADGAGFEAILPSKAADVLSGLLSRDGNGEVLAMSDGQTLRVCADGWMFTAKCISGKYPAYRRVIPASRAFGGTVDRAALLEALERAEIAADRDSPRVDMSFSPGGMRLRAKGGDTESDETLPMMLDGEMAASIRMNPALLASALEVLDEDEVTLRWDSSGPIVVTCSIPWIAAIMPYRPTSGGGAKKEGKE